jgi:hypothetical protein
LKTSIPLTSFIKKYSDYCIKNGYRILNFRENEKLLDRYKLKIVTRSDKSTKAFINI